MLVPDFIAGSRLLSGGELVTIGSLEQLTTFFSFELLRGRVLRDCSEKRIYESIGVSLSAFAGVAAMVETRADQHFPDCWIAPVVKFGLRPDAYVKVVVSAIQVGWHGKVRVPLQTHHIFPQLLKGRIKSLLIIFALSFTVTNHATAVANVNQNTSVVDSV